MGKPLTPIFDRRRDRRPTRFAELRIGVFEARRRGYGAVVVAHAAMLAADLVERLAHFFDKARDLGPDRLDHVSRGVFVSWKVGLALQVQQLVERKSTPLDSSH